MKRRCCFFSLRFFLQSPPLSPFPATYGRLLSSLFPLPPTFKSAAPSLHRMITESERMFFFHFPTFSCPFPMSKWNALFVDATLLRSVRSVLSPFSHRGNGSLLCLFEPTPRSHSLGPFRGEFDLSSSERLSPSPKTSGAFTHNILFILLCTGSRLFQKCIVGLQTSESSKSLGLSESSPQLRTPLSLIVTR